MTWRPTEILDYLSTNPSSTRPLRVETDVGEAFVKALGNPEGSHALASEWIVTSLARLLKLRTFDFAILEIDDLLPLPLGAGRGNALPGPAFVTRKENGFQWGGTAEGLRSVRNPEDISGLIVFDTFVRNRDRWLAGRTAKYDNVFLSQERTGPEGMVELVAMDHTHCMSDQADLSPPMLRRVVGDIQIFGTFPQFLPYWREDATLSMLARLDKLRPEELNPILAAVPDEWEVDGTTKKAIKDFLMERARLLTTMDPATFRPQEEEEAG